MPRTLLSAITKFDKHAELSLDWYNVFMPDAEGKPRVVGHIQGTWVVEAEKAAKKQFGDQAFVRVVDATDGKLPIGLEFGKRPTLMGSTKIKFRPGEVEGMVAEALRMLPGKPPRYQHDATGSTVEFHNAHQLQTYIQWLNDYSNDAEMAEDPEMAIVIGRVKDTIQHIMSQMPQAANDGNPVLASLTRFDKQAATWQSYPGELEYVPEDDQRDEPPDDFFGHGVDMRHLSPKITDFHTWLQAVEQTSPEPELNTSYTPGAQAFWRKLYDKGLTPQQANDEAFQMDDFDDNSVLASVRKFDKQAEHDPNKWWESPEYQAGAAKLKDKTNITDFDPNAPNPQDLEPRITPFHIWMEAVSDLMPDTAPDIAPRQPGYWKGLYKQNLSPADAIEMMWGEHPGHTEASTNPLLQAVAKFDRRADYKVQPPVKPSATESKELKSYKDDEYPRASSESVKDIANKYNVRHESYKYKDNIMEAAHPDKKIIMPAYDKMNTLLENEMERQRINLNIMRKPVSGLEYRQKYAELLKTLLKTANDMDFKKQEQLSKLADATIERLQKEAGPLEDIGKWFGEKYEDVKDVGGGLGSGAILGGIAGGLIGAFGGPLAALEGAYTGARIGGVLGGVVSAIAATGPTAKNVQINAKQAEDALNELVKEHPGDIFLSTLTTSLAHIQETAAKYAALTSQIQATTSKPSLDSMSGQHDPNAAMQLGQEYIAEIKKLDTDIDVFRANVAKGDYATNESDLESKIKTPFRGLFGGTAHTADRAMEQLERVAEKAVKEIEETKLHAASASSPAIGEPGQSEVESLLGVLPESVKKSLPQGLLQGR